MWTNTVIVTFQNSVQIFEVAPVIAKNEKKEGNVVNGKMQLVQSK